MVSKVLHTCTAGFYRNFFNQSSTQQITKIALPLIVGLGIIWTIVHYGKNLLSTNSTNTKQPPTKKTDPSTTTSADEKSSPSFTLLSKYKLTKTEYSKGLNPIPGKATALTATIDSYKEASEFFDLAQDSAGDIRLWSNDEPRKMQKAAFMELSEQWISRGGKVFHPQERKPVVVDSNTLCSPWCHEGKNRSALVCDFLMRAGHQETLLPDGAKDGYLFPELNVASDAEDSRYPVIKATTGFFAGSVVRIGDKFKSESVELQTGFTDLFNGFATVDKPVMIFAFVSAVPLLMREIMKRTANTNLSNITLVAFHHSDPMADVPDPCKRANVGKSAPWVVQYKLEEQLGKAQWLYDQWDDTSKQNAALRSAGKNEFDPERQKLTTELKRLSDQFNPIKEELLFHSRMHAVQQFQTEELAKLICVTPAK